MSILPKSDDIDEIVKEYVVDKKALSTLCSESQAVRRIVRGLLEHRGITVRNHGSRSSVMTDQEYDRAHEMRRNGLSWQKVADALNVPAYSVQASYLRKEIELLRKSI